MRLVEPPLAGQIGKPAAWPSRRWPGQSLQRWGVCVVSLLYYSLVALSAWVARSLGRGPARLVLLYYHAVPNDYRALFAAQMDRVVARADAVVHADFAGSGKPGQLLVGVTFDDAFESVAENAVPELLVRDIPATIFAPAGVLGRRPDWKMEADAEGRFEHLMDPARLRAISSPLIRIGSHSFSHRSLSLADDPTALAEIAGSKRRLTELLAVEVDTFSFPYGELDGHNGRLEQLCRQAGYRFAFTSEPKAMNPKSGTFLRGRVPIRQDDSLVEFWLKMGGAYGWLPSAWAVRDWIKARRRAPAVESDPPQNPKTAASV